MKKMLRAFSIFAFLAVLFAQAPAFAQSFVNQGGGISCSNAYTWNSSAPYTTFNPADMAPYAGMSNSQLAAIVYPPYPPIMFSIFSFYVSSAASTVYVPVSTTSAGVFAAEVVLYRNIACGASPGVYNPPVRADVTNGGTNIWLNSGGWGWISQYIDCDGAATWYMAGVGGNNQSPTPKIPFSNSQIPASYYSLNDHQLASMAWQYAIAPFPASYQTGILVSELQGMWMDFANGMGGTHLAFTPGGDTPSDFAAEVLLWRRIACPASDSLPPAPPPPPAPPAPAAVLLPPPPTYGTTPGPGNINIGGAGSGTANGSFNGAGSGGRTSVPFDYTAACSAPSPSGEIRSPAWIANCLASLGQ